MTSLLQDATSATIAPRHGRSAGTASRAGGQIPEIHGLRGLALVLVVVFHLFGAGRVSGGVDVFLVVSGFVVTRSLARRAAEGRLRITENWARTAGRLVPSGLIVLIAVAAAAWWLMPAGRLTEVGREIAASALYYENWELINSQLQYGAAGPMASPLQHFWSLAVQGQFLLVWPLVVGALVGMARGAIRRGRSGTWPLAVFLVLTTAASFAYAMWLVGVSQPVAYFHSLSRFWEIGLGALFALLVPALPVPHWLRALVAWLGLGLVASSGFLFDGAALFPGVQALWPVGGALLVLIGAGTRAGWGPRGFLGLPPLRFLADISYELYLWHWPILVFLLVYTGQATVTPLQAAGILAASVLLAWLTNLAVATPLRKAVGKARFPSLAFAGLGVAAALVAVPVTWYVVQEEAEQQAQLAALEEAAARRDALAADQSQLAWKPRPGYPGPFVLGRGATLPTTRGSAPIPGVDLALADMPRSLAERCTQESGDGDGYEKVTVCPVVEPEDPARTVVILGASHEYQWEPALERIAKVHDWRLITIGKGACRIEVRDPADVSDCAVWSRAAVQKVIGMRPDAVVVNSTRTSPRGMYERVVPGQLAAWKKLQAAGVRTIGIRDNPRYRDDPLECIAEYGSSARACNEKTRGSVLAPVNPVAKLKGGVPAASIDMSDWLCTADVCPLVVGNIMVYRDRGHLTSTYARELAPMLERQLQARAAWMFDDAAKARPLTPQHPRKPGPAGPGPAQPGPKGSPEPAPSVSPSPSPPPEGFVSAARPATG
ncbi:acyltransferase family protein [Myceligenerans crystallogenes]|uniref:Acyltransferase family protein n=1 Tax=Myceligenerans crystallogenes TaxID=316335 RepID=A0ABN2NBG8_9MICO